jgi:hypothetical protein
MMINMVMSKYKTAREAILTTPSWQDVKDFLYEIGEYILFFGGMFFLFRLFGLLV